MHSARKAEANRANAQKSTGPRSAAGKARSSHNATRHGMLAATATLLAEPNREIETLLARYRSEFRPAGVHEEMLVSELAVADWRIKQIARIETGALWCQMEGIYNDILDADRPVRWEDPRPNACGVCGTAPEPAAPDEAESEPPRLSEASEDMRTLLMGAAWVANPASFALVVRYQNQARRDYFRALKQLEQVRTGKAAYLPEEPPSRVGQTIPQEPKPPASETKPTAAPARTAAAASTGETKPNVPGLNLQWDIAPFVAYDPDWRRKLYEGNGKKKGQ